MNSNMEATHEAGKEGDHDKSMDFGTEAKDPVHINIENTPTDTVSGPTCEEKESTDSARKNNSVQESLHTSHVPSRNPSPCPIVGFGPRSGSCSTSGNIKSRGTSASVSSFGNSPLTLEKEKGLISSMIGSLFTPSQGPSSLGNMASVTTNTTITKAEAEQNALHSFNFRPKGLPPKNPEEVEKQRIEVDRIHAMLIQKELDEAKKMEAREHAIMVNVGKWKTDFLPNWPAKKGTKAVRDAVYCGVPPMVREKAWCVALGNELQITKDLYEIFQMSAQQKRTQRRNVTDRLGKSLTIKSPADTIVSSRGDSGDSSSSIADEDRADPSMSTYDVNTHQVEKSISYVGREASATLIELDLGRTFPALDFFRVGGPFHETLRIILETYVSYRPDIGYVQGMSFIASVLLLYVGELDAFICFANILNRPVLMTFFRMEMSGIEPCIKTFNHLLEEYVPAVATHMNELGLHCDMFLIDWFLTIFSKSLPIDVATRIWDIFVVVGDVVMWRTSVAIFKLYQKKFITLDFEDAAHFVTHIPTDLDVEKLVRHIRNYENSITEKKIDTILKRHGYIPTRTRP